jgi:tetratricopeptide (TPR) repeat protein
LHDRSKAIDSYEQALTIAQELRDRRAEGNAFANLGLVHGELGDRDKARACWLSALRIYEEIEDPNAMRVRDWLDKMGPREIGWLHESGKLNGE